MGKFDDPRVLEATIVKLQQDVTHLKKATLPLAAQQRGPIPGFMRAVQISDANQKSSMWLALNGNVPGQAPYEAVSDSNGTVRVELGNLAANGVSPAQFGLRVNDALNNPLFDSLGVIGPMTPLVQQGQGAGNQQIVGPATAAAVTNGSATFTVPRQLRVLSVFTCVYSATSLAAAFGYMNTAMDGSDGGSPSPNHHVMVVGGTAGTTASIMGVNSRIDTLSTGSHTAAVTMDVDNGLTIQIFRSSIFVYQLGS